MGTSAEAAGVGRAAVWRHSTLADDTAGAPPSRSLNGAGLLAAIRSLVPVDGDLAPDASGGAALPHGEGAPP